MKTKGPLFLQQQTSYSLCVPFCACHVSSGAASFLHIVFKVWMGSSLETQHHASVSKKGPSGIASRMCVFMFPRGPFLPRPVRISSNVGADRAQRLRRTTLWIRQHMERVGVTGGKGGGCKRLARSRKFTTLDSGSGGARLFAFESATAGPGLLERRKRLGVQGVEAALRKELKPAESRFVPKAIAREWAEKLFALQAGTDALAANMRSALATRSGTVLVSLDGRSAYDSMSWAAFLCKLRLVAPELLAFVRLLYGCTYCW